MIHYTIAASFIFVSIVATYYTMKWKHQKEVTHLNKRNSSNYTLFKSKTDTLCMAIDEKANALILQEAKTNKLLISLRITSALLEEAKEKMETSLNKG